MVSVPKEKIYDVLSFIVSILKHETFLWRVDGSVNLLIQGLPAPVHDIDIVTDMDGIRFFRKKFAKKVIKDFYNKDEKCHSLICTFSNVEIEINYYDSITTDLFPKLEKTLWRGLSLPSLPLETAAKFYVAVERKDVAQKILADIKVSETITLRSTKDIRLVGTYFNEHSLVTVILVHGLAGDKSEYGRFDELSNILCREGYNVLAFDFSGCGESDDDSITVKKLVSDLSSAIDFAEEKGAKKIVLVGLSLGGLICLTLSRPIVHSMVLWTPVTSAKKDYERKFTKEKLLELKKKKIITLPVNNEKRKNVILAKEFIRERETINQKELLSKVKIPVFIIHGKKDMVIPVKDSKKSISLLPPESKILIVPSADHNFMRELDEFILPTVRWIKEKCSVKTTSK